MDKLLLFQYNSNSECWQEEETKKTDFFRELIQVYQDNLHEDPATVLGALFFHFGGEYLIPQILEYKEEEKNGKKTEKIEKKTLVKWKTDPISAREKYLNWILQDYQKGTYWQGVAIILDSLDFLAVDVDNVNLFSEKVQNIDEFLKEVKELAPLITKTVMKGYHIFLPKALFKDLLKHINNHHLSSEYGFEIKHQNLITIPPSRLKHNGKVYEYKIISVNPDFNTEDLVEKLKKLPGIQKILQIVQLETVGNQIANKYREIQNSQKEEIRNIQVEEECDAEEYFKAIEETKEKVKREVSFKDLIPMNFAKSMSRYDLYHCPFHPPDHHPSFAVYRFGNMEIGIDFHDGKTYDVIKFLREYKGLEFMEALKELCEIAHVNFPEKLKKKKKKERQEDIKEREERKEEKKEERKENQIEEKIVALSLQLLQDSRYLECIEEVIDILKFLTTKDFIMNTHCATIIQTILKNANIIHDRKIFLQKIRSELHGVISYDWFYSLFTIPFPQISIDILKDLIQELIVRWKDRKKREIIQNLQRDTEKVEEYLKALQEVQELNFERDFAIKKLLSRACPPEAINVDFEFLYPDFLPKGTVNIWVAPPGQGKSALALLLGLYLLDIGTVDKVLYYDADNPLTVLKQRKVDQIIQRYQGKLFYFIEDNYLKFQNDVMAAKVIQENCLIIIDTLRAFAGPRDLNKGENAEDIMRKLKELTFTGTKTVIVLHHVNKPSNNPNVEKIDRVKGATELRDRADIIYLIEKRQHKQGMLYIAAENLKPRIPVAERKYFKLDMENIKLREVPDILTEEEEAFIQAALEVMEAHYREKSSYPSKKFLEETLKDEFGRNQTRAWLEKFEGRFWKKTYITYKHQFVYKPLKKEEKNQINQENSEKNPF